MKRQVLIGSDRSPNIREALSARTKDPLWFLVRQWQSGEFEAENGGGLVDVRIASQSFQIDKIEINEKQRKFKAADPLEALIEAEDEAGVASAWKKEALEYRFDLLSDKHTLSADDYSGFGLDWYQFDLAKALKPGKSNIKTQAFIPTQMSFPGAPEPQWWRMQKAETYYDMAKDIAPNTASILLPEFFYTDINNWHLIPLPLPTGSLTRIASVQVVDSFGVVSDIAPIQDKDWQVFKLCPTDSKNSDIAAELFYSPNIALDIVHNDPIEDVRFIRDEQSNLVWAWEHLYIDDAGEAIRNGDGLAVAKEALAADDSIPVFKLMSELPSNWIPYVPRFIDKNDITSGQIHLRRARTQQVVDPVHPEHNSKLVGESKIIHEEEIPKTGLRVRRMGRFARGSDGKAHFWTGRHKDAGQGTGRPNLRFDYVANRSSSAGE